MESILYLSPSTDLILQFNEEFFLQQAASVTIYAKRIPTLSISIDQTLKFHRESFQMYTAITPPFTERNLPLSDLTPQFNREFCLLNTDITPSYSIWRESSFLSLLIYYFIKNLSYCMLPHTIFTKRIFLLSFFHWSVSSFIENSSYAFHHTSLFPLS